MSPAPTSAANITAAPTLSFARARKNPAGNREVAQRGRNREEALTLGPRATLLSRAIRKNLSALPVSPQARRAALMPRGDAALRVCGETNPARRSIYPCPAAPHGDILAEEQAF